MYLKFSLSKVKINVCPRDDLLRSSLSAASKLIQTNLTDPDVELFENLTP